MATAIAGLGGYVITALVARTLDQDYKTFAIFWSALYLVVGALAGVQQEVTRSTHLPGRVPIDRPANVWRVSGTFALFVVVLIPLSALAWAPAVFGSLGALVVPLTFGAATYIFVAAASGTMYGIHLWRPLSMIIVLDVALRLVLIALGLFVGANLVLLAWATVIPFPLVLLMLWLFARKRLTGTNSLDVHYSAAVSNVARTVVAAASTAVLVSGFPLLLGSTSPDESSRHLSTVIFALTLTRAPLVVSALALQSYLIVYFRDRAHSWVRSYLVFMGGVAGVGLVLAVIAFFVGDPVIVAIAGAGFSIDPAFLALLVLSSVPTAWLAITGTAVLARARHNYYTIGWVVAALAAIALLFVPGTLEFRTLLALSVGPMAGLLVELIALGVESRRARAVPVT